MFLVMNKGNSEKAAAAHAAFCLNELISCLKNASKGLPDIDPEADEDEEVDPGYDIQPVKIPVAVPSPINCGPQWNAGSDNRSWVEWATDQCVDIWTNDLGLPLPPKIGLPQPDISGFMQQCVDSLRACPSHPPIPHTCTDGCVPGISCNGSYRGPVFCPSPAPGVPFPQPGPIPNPFPILPVRPIFVIP